MKATPIVGLGQWISNIDHCDGIGPADGEVGTVHDVADIDGVLQLILEEYKHQHDPWYLAEEFRPLIGITAELALLELQRQHEGKLQHIEDPQFQ